MDDELDIAARRLVAMAELDEVVRTDALKTVVAEAGGVLVGLDNRVKELPSLKRKLLDLLAIVPELSIAEAAALVYDVLRFTVVADPQNYVAVRDAVLAELELQGVTVVDARNRWAGPGYRGINVRLEAGVDQRFEVQFHTPESYAANKATRGQYEELRLSGTAPERAAELQAAIDEAFSRVEIPPGAIP